MTTNELIEKYGIGHNCLSDAYALGMAHELDALDIAVEVAEAKARVDVIEEVKALIQSRLVDSLCLENATKYGNKNAEQQSNSYAKIMRYDVADCVDDLLDDLEQLKEKSK